MANRRCEQVINPFSVSGKRKANGIRCTIQERMLHSSCKLSGKLITSVSITRVSTCVETEY